MNDNGAVNSIAPELVPLIVELGCRVVLAKVTSSVVNILVVTDFVAINLTVVVDVIAVASRVALVVVFGGVDCC